MSKRCLLLYFILCSFIVAHAQINARFLHFNVRDGLSQNSVHCIFQDRDGLMWSGTQDGLNSFDGKDLTVYRHDDNDTSTISDQFVVAIKEDKDGHLWIGTRNGLNRFNKRTGKFTRFYVNEKEKHTFQAHYTHFYFQKDGKIVIPRNPVAILDPVTKTFQKIPLPDSAIVVHVTDNYKVFFVSTKMQQYVCNDIRRPQYQLLNEKPLPLAFTGIPWTDKNANDTLGSLAI